MKRPNIVMLVNDQEAYYRHGWDGGVQPFRPNFDRLAAAGVRFSRAYTACPLCTPARLSMMTGLLPHNHGYLTLDPAEDGPHRSCSTVFAELAGAGYDLYHYGKWHAGPGTSADHGCVGVSRPGFGNPYLTDDYRAYCRRSGIREASFNLEHVFLEPVSPDRPVPGPGYQCRAADLHPHVTGTLETETDGHEAFFLANMAAERLEQIAGSERPFFLRVDFYGPHAPYLVSPEYARLYPPHLITEYGSFQDDLVGKPAVYRKEWNSPFGNDGRLKVPNALPWTEWQRILRYVYAHVTQVDAAGGIVLDALDRLDLSANTVVVWTADHGDPIGAHGGHFGKESFLSEEAIRIPMTIRWPERIAGGQETDALAGNVDVPVTLLDAAQTAFPDTVDGASLLNLLDDDGSLDTDAEWRRSIVSETHGHHWESVVGRALVTDRYHLAAYRYGEVPDFVRPGDLADDMVELYDLVSDPFQLTNLALDPDCFELRDALFAELVDEQRRTSDTCALRER